MRVQTEMAVGKKKKKKKKRKKKPFHCRVRLGKEKEKEKANVLLVEREMELHLTHRELRVELKLLAREERRGEYVLLAKQRGRATSDVSDREANMQRRSVLHYGMSLSSHALMFKN